MMNTDGSSVTQLISHDFRNPGWNPTASSGQPGRPTERSIAFVRTSEEDIWTVHILALAKSETSLLSHSQGSRWAGFALPGHRTERDFCCNSAGQLPASTGTARISRATWRIGTVTRCEDAPGKSGLVTRWKEHRVRQVYCLGRPAVTIGEMRILVLEDGSVRQLIPDAVAPALPDYWDSQPAWSRVKL